MESANCCWLLGRPREKLDYQGEWTLVNGSLLISMELCQYFHNWHGTIVSTHYHICTALGWSGLSNFFSQNMMARQAAAAAPGSCLKRKIPGFHLRSPKSKSAFWHDPQVISVPLTILEVMVYKIGLSYLQCTGILAGAHRQSPKSTGFHWEEKDK